MMLTKTKAKGAVAAKPPALVFHQDEEAANAIETIGAAARELERLKLDLQEHIAGIKAAFESEAQPLVEGLAATTAALRAYCERHRDRLVKEGTKQIHFPTGVVQWRELPPSVAIRKADEVIAACRALGLDQFLRQKTEVDKEAMLAAPETARTIAGVTIRSPGEQFYVKPTALDVELDTRGEVVA